MDANVKSVLRKDIMDMLDEERIVILTSHDISECESLCSRVGLMENGVFKFLGKASDLEDECKRAYRIVIWLDRREACDEKHVRLKQFLSEHFEKTQLAKIRHDFVEIRLPVSLNKLSEIFLKIEANRSALSIEDYSISHTTLCDHLIFNDEQL